MHKDTVSYSEIRQAAKPYREAIAQEREQHYYFTLHDFEELVRQYGFPKISKDLAEDVWWIIEGCFRSI